MHRSKSGLIVIAAIALCVSTAVAEIVWVKSEAADVRTGKGAIFPSVLTVVKGQPLEVIAHDGHWMQIKIDATHTGWVFDSSISASEVKGNSGFNLPGTVGTVNNGAASKGFSETTMNYATNKHFSAAPLQRLENIRKSIPPEEWVDFTKAIQPGR